MKINVLELITGLPIGGAEKVLLDLCRNLDRSKIEPFVIGLNDESDFKKDFEKENIHVNILNMQKNIVSFIRTYRQLSLFIKHRDITIIHAHMFHPLVFAYALKLRYPHLKIVWTSHSENINGKIREVFVYLLKSFRDIDIIFSKKMQSFIYKKEARIITNGVDLALFNHKVKKRDTFTFINISIFREAKNQAFLAECAKYLKEQGYDFVINIIGSGDHSGDCSKEIKEAIQKNDMEDYIKLLGTRRDIEFQLKSSHCFVLPSYYEGLPIVLLEAGAAKVPILSTPVGAIPDIINESTGYLCNLEQFAKMMEHILNHYDEAKNRAECFYQKICRDLSIESMAKKHEEIYCTLYPIDSDSE
jgi:glycosyltransferase involved in cell wall biosynthesis